MSKYKGAGYKDLGAIEKRLKEQGEKMKKPIRGFVKVEPPPPVVVNLSKRDMEKAIEFLRTEEDLKAKLDGRADTLHIIVRDFSKLGIIGIIKSILEIASYFMAKK